MTINYLSAFKLICIFLLLSSCVYAQDVTILDSAKKLPVAGATISVLNQTTGKIEKQGATSVAGVFTFDRSGDNVFYLSVTATGYKKAVVKLTANNQTVLLVPDTKQLKEVNISAPKSPIKFNGNILEYDISQVPNADYLNLSDIIDHLPFLQVSDDGAIKMMGETLTILIDNKPNIIYKDAQSLKAIPPQAIDKIEVTLTPTARNGGKTLNITLKRDYFLGWNGSVDIGGSRLTFTPLASVSYWRKKFGFDASANYGYNISSATNNTNIDYVQQQSTLNSNDEVQRRGKQGNFNFSSFYNINEFDSFDLQFSISPSRNNSTTNSTIITQTGATQDMSFSAIDNNLSTLSYGVSLNYTHKYLKPGNVFYLLTSFRNPTSNRDQLLINSAGNGSMLENNLYTNSINNTESTFEAILQQNSNKKFRYTIGSKLIIRDNKSNNTLDTNNVIAITPFTMKQLVSSTYLDDDWSVKKFTVHTGLRFDYNTNNYTEPVLSKQEFTNFTPNISLTYNIDPANLLMLTYGRRVTRPGAYALIPAVTPVNTYQQSSGSENLNNQINNNWGIQHYGNYKLVRLGFNFNYSRIRGLIREISTLGNEDIIQSVSTNVNLYESYTAGFSADFTLLKRFRFSLSSNYSYLVQTSGIYSNKLWSGYLSDRVSYQVDKQNSFDLSALAYSPNITLQGVDQGMAYLNWNLSYGHYFDWMKKFPTAIRISVLNPDHYNGLPGYSTINSPSFTLRSDTKRSNPIIGLSIRVQIKGKQLGNRTFNKTKSIQNNDLSSPGG